MDSRLLNNTAKMGFLVLMLLFAHASTSPTVSPVTQSVTEHQTKDNYFARDDKSSSAITVDINSSVVTEAVKIVPINSGKENSYYIANDTVSRNSSETSGQGKGTSLNLAIIPVLAIFFIITFVCIKCCNRVKADVVKDRDYVEDGKPLFRIEPESHSDYLSSIGSAYNPYSTVTSGYNPYSTVTTMMSNMSTISETKDAGTMVKPRDIWKTMRHARGSSVPDLEELARERDLIENVAEEVKKLKSKNHLLPQTNSSVQSRSSSASPRAHRSSLKSRKSTRPKLQKTSVSTSADNVLDSRHHQRNLIHADVEYHSESPSSTREASIPDECQALMDSTEDTESESSPNPSTSVNKPFPKLSTNDVILPVDEPRDSAHRSGSGSSCDGSSPDGSKGSLSRSGFRGPGRAKSLSVSFQDGCESPKRNSQRNRSPPSSPTKSPPPKDVEIVRKPVPSAANLQRKFSLSKVQDYDKISSQEISSCQPSGEMSPASLSGSEPSDQATKRKLHANSESKANSKSAKSSHGAGVTHKQSTQSSLKCPKDGSPGIHRKPNGNAVPFDSEHVVRNGVSSGSSPVVLPVLSCH